jgi:hypothetical protein
MTNSPILHRLLKLVLVISVTAWVPARGIEAQEYPQFDTNINLSAGVSQFDLGQALHRLLRCVFHFH